MQLHRILEPLSRTDHAVLLGYGAGVSLLVILVRMLWVFAMSYSLRGLGVPLRRGEPHPRWQRVFIVSWSGMRGAISLAAALSIPLFTSLGLPFPQRDLIIFLTFSVIVSTLLLQGLSLPWLIRSFGIDGEGRRERAEAGHQEVEARRRAAEASLVVLAARRREGAYPAGVLDRLEDQYRYRSGQFRAHLDGDHDGAVEQGTHQFNAQAELIETERRVMLQMRKSGGIDDETLRRIEKDLDLQEMRLRQGIAEYEFPRRPSGRPFGVKPASVLILGLLFIAAGANHFISPGFYLSIMPAYLPWHLALVYVQRGGGDRGRAGRLVAADAAHGGVGVDRVTHRGVPGERANADGWPGDAPFRAGPLAVVGAAAVPTGLDLVGPVDLPMKAQ